MHTAKAEPRELAQVRLQIDLCLQRGVALQSWRAQRMHKTRAFWRWLHPLKSSLPFPKRSYESNLICSRTVVCSELNRAAGKEQLRALGLKLHA